MKTRICLASAALALLVAGCGAGAKSTRQLRLPQGNAEKGRVAFVALNCTSCHTVAGVELPQPTVVPATVVRLGGEVERMRTVGDLLTSIIHPAYGMSENTRSVAVSSGKSLMPVVNDVMTVAEMIDLVAFLQPRYRPLPPPEDWYNSM